MTLTKAKILKYIAIGVVAVLLATILGRIGKRQQREVHVRSYDEILREGVLRAVTEYNSISYYADGDSVAGFDYELIKAFARDKGLRVEIVPEMSFEKRLQGLLNGTYDLIAYGIPTTSELKDSLLLTNPIVLSKQILIQRKPDFDSAFYIKSQLDLARCTLHVEKGAPSILRIRHLGNEIGDTIYVKEIGKYGPEQLMAMVAHGNIRYAVADETIARACIDSFPQLDISTGIGFTQFYAWGVNKQSPALLDSLNTWLDRFTIGKEYKQIYNKYFK